MILATKCINKKLWTVPQPKCLLEHQINLKKFTKNNDYTL